MPERSGSTVFISGANESLSHHGVVRCSNQLHVIVPLGVLHGCTEICLTPKDVIWVMKVYLRAADCDQGVWMGLMGAELELNGPLGVSGKEVMTVSFTGLHVVFRSLLNNFHWQLRNKQPASRRGGGVAVILVVFFHCMTWQLFLDIYLWWGKK